MRRGRTTPLRLEADDALSIVNVTATLDNGTAYDIYLNTSHGKTLTWSKHRVQAQAGSLQNLTGDGSYESRDDAYSRLPTSTDVDRYRLVHPSASSCADSFTVRVWDPAPNRPAHDVDLYLGQGELGTNTSDYEIKETGPNSTESYTVSNVDDDEVWTLLVAHENATETTYGAYHYVDCGSEEPDEDDCLLSATPGVGPRPLVRAGPEFEGRCSGLPGDWEGGAAGPDPGYGRDRARDAGRDPGFGRTGPGVAPVVAGAAAAALAAARLAVRRRRGWTVPGVARGRWPGTEIRV